MNKLVCGLLILCALALFAPPARADFAAGVAAFRDGDYKTAYTAWRPLAEQGNAAAQYNLGTLYNQGLGRAIDLVEAAKWYRRAAQGGNPNAQLKMGVFLAKGLGLAQDYGEAISWFREAAEQHNAQAQFNLGILYATGSGVDRDRVQALMWLNLAHTAGVEQAAQPRRMLIREMAPEEVEEAALLGEIMQPPESPSGMETIPAPPASEPEPEFKPTAKVPDIVVHLASYESPQAAVEGWRQLSRVHDDLLGSLEYGVAIVDLGEQGTFYRLLAGPFETDALAASLCASLKARNIFCATSF